MSNLLSVLREKSGYVLKLLLDLPVYSQPMFCDSVDRLCMCGVQGFDEFMNLVVDDAVEVKMASKDETESRRELGTSFSILQILSISVWEIADTISSKP